MRLQRSNNLSLPLLRCLLDKVVVMGTAMLVKVATKLFKFLADMIKLIILNITTGLITRRCSLNRGTAQIALAQRLGLLKSFSTTAESCSNYGMLGNSIRRYETMKRVFMNISGHFGESVSLHSESQRPSSIFML